MKRYDDCTASATFAVAKRYISTGIPAILLLIAFGCAHPKPVTIRHESTPSQSDAAMTRLQSRKEPVDLAKETAAKKPDQAAPAPAQPAAPNTEGKGTAAAQESRAALEAHQPDVAAPALVQSAELSTEGTGTTAIEEARAAQEAHERELIETVTARVTEEVRKAVEDEVRSDVMNEMYREIWKVNSAMKEKDQRLRFGGDIRLRYEKDLFDKNNYNAFTKITQGLDTQVLQNTWADQDLFKYRVRFGAEAKVNEQADAVIRVSTGTTTNPVSTNTTMNDYMNKDSVVFDLAYLRWKPGKSLTLYGGRMPNPWFSSDLVWDSDLNFEGLALNVRPPVTESSTLFLTVGAFPLQSSDPAGISDFSQHSKWLYAGQVGLESKDRKGISAKIGAAYYDFSNITGVRNDDPTGHPGATDWSAPLFTQGSQANTLFYIDRPNTYKVGLASEFKELNFTGTLDIGFWDPVHIVFLGDYVKNIGFNQSDVIERTQDPATPKEITGYQIGISIGYPVIQEQKQWKVYFYSKRLGRDAVVDAFTDSDFHLGGTNAKGWIFGADIGLARNYWLTARWLTADEISGEPLSIDVLQVDINARF
jgi:hypothetical protein